MKIGLKKISVAMSIIVTTALFSGCGGTSSNNTNTTTLSQNFSPTKVDRAWYEDVNTDDSNAKISFSIGEKIINLTVTNIDGINFRHNQFFINTDNNKNTGNEALDGADYLIEDSHIFRSTRRDWSWEYMGELNNLQVSDDLHSVEITINRELITQLANQISIINFQRDTNWKPLMVTQATIDLQENNNNNQLTRDDIFSAIQRAHNENRLSSIEYNGNTLRDIIFSQFGNQALLDFDPDQEGLVHDWLAYDARDDSFQYVGGSNERNNYIRSMTFESRNIISYEFSNKELGVPTPLIYYKYQYNFDTKTRTLAQEVLTHSVATIEDTEMLAAYYLDDYDDIVPTHIQIFINSDANTQTGYAGYHGADFMIEDGNLYRSTGRDWSWQYVKELKYSLSDAAKGYGYGIAIIEYDKGDLGELKSNNFKNIVQYTSVTLDENWNHLKTTETGRVDN